ncbi:Dipeptide ABC transporter periplasmic dipeptide-binding protein, partial [Pseudomonas syringae pv. tagetis]|uniref:ABC transporter substrate-binding protein n=1 Tax=Pseudomonas syringae group genomosp. 7 TaxID=251699 RepID=UPI000F40A4C1
MKLRLKRLPWLLCLALTATLMHTPPALARGETPVDQLVVGMSMINLLSLDPAGATGLEVSEVNANVYDMLLEQDAARPDQLIPALAERWEISPDRMRLTFHLRSDVTFHSGNPLTAQDVAWSLQRVVTLNKALASTWKAYGYTAGNVSELMRAEGPSTFVLDLPKATDPKLVLNTLATSPSAFVIDRLTALQHARGDDLGAAWLTTHTAGSGAFKLDIWRANDVILMSRFEQYWRGPARLRRVIMRNMTESQALRLMVERGDLDVARGMAATDIKALTRSKEVTVQTIPRGTLYYVALSMEQPLFQDIRVRQAIRALIDYQGINTVVMPHYGLINQRPLQLGLAARLDDPGYALNVAEAKRLLAEAGHPDGFRITIRSLTDSPFINIATSLQSTLAQAGIQASIITGTGNQIYGAMRARPECRNAGRALRRRS